jgi:hypothetical protein
MQVRRTAPIIPSFQSQPLTNILASVPQREISAAAAIQPVLLPKAVQEAKAAVIAIAGRNTTRTDNLAAVRAELAPHVKTLNEYFTTNRPKNELQITQGTWRSIWIEDTSIDGAKPLSISRDKIWQVIKDDSFFNVSEAQVRVAGRRLFSVQNFLKGNFTIVQPKPDDQLNRKNIISILFGDNKVALGSLPTNESLNALTDRIDSKKAFAFDVPGPRGVRGELWNLFVDGDLRIAAGSRRKNQPGQDWYVLTREKGMNA